MEEFKNSHCRNTVSELVTTMTLASTYSIFKDLEWASETTEHNVVAKTLRSENLFALHGVSRSLLHVAIDVESIVFEAPFIDNDVSCQDGVLDVFYESRLGISYVLAELGECTYRT